MITLAEAVGRAEQIGRGHGMNAASWWEQDAIGGRSTGDARDTAQRVLTGIGEGDPAVLDGLPYPDLSGQWGVEYTPAMLREDLNLDYPKYDDLQDDLCRAYEDGFLEASIGEIERMCQEAIDAAP